MTVVLKTDSDSYVHQLWAQEQASSCAVASIWMARNQARQQTVDESEWSLAWSLFSDVVQPMPLSTTPRPEPAPRTFNPSAYQSNQLTMGNMFANFGTFMNQVADKLRMDGLNADVSASSVVNPARLADDKPAIVLLGWYSGGKRNGGHFIVAARVTSSGKIVYLDPWGGQLNELGAGPGYQATGKFEQIVYISRRH